MVEGEGGELELPKRIGPFELHERLGHGGTAVVYEAANEQGDRVALKLIRHRATGRRAKMLVVRFLREAEVLKRLRDPGIVELKDAGSSGDLVYLAMERIRGGSLESVRAQGPLDFDAVLWLGLKLAKTLELCHDLGVVHRDIKPSNILITPNGDPKIIDFGIATFDGAANITRQNDILGTLGYIAPEALDGQRATHLADQYSLGRVLLTLATKASLTARAKSSVRGKDLVTRLMEGLAVDWRAFPRSGPWSALQIVIQRMVNEHPEHRIRDMSGCALALETLWTATRTDEARPRRTLAARLGSLGSRVFVADTVEDAGSPQPGLDQRAVETMMVRRRGKGLSENIRGPSRSPSSPRLAFSASAPRSPVRGSGSKVS